MRIGIDLGGTKIETIAINSLKGELLRRRISTPQSNYQATLVAICDLVNEVENELGEQGTVGIGTPGAISPVTGLLRNSNSICLNNMPLKTDIELMLGRSVRMANDANCFALSESIDGSAKDATIVFGVIIGTGVGSGLVINRGVLQGANAIAGEWGHNPLPWPHTSELPGLDCYCGKQGCIETWLSGVGFARNFEAKYGGKLSSEEIVRAANHGDENCELAVCEYEDRMARSLAHVINILDPDVIVLGGGMSKVVRLYDNVPKLWSKYIFSDTVNTRLIQPLHGDSSGVRGAAFLY